MSNLLMNTRSKSINLKIVFLVIVLLLLLTGNIFFGIKYFAIQKELQQTSTAIAIQKELQQTPVVLDIQETNEEIQKINEKVLEFIKLFIEKVLKAEDEIDFETRLELESAVRNLNDEEILTQWQRFIESKTESEAQKEVKNLLEILINKI